MTPEQREKLTHNPGIICIIGPEGSGKSLLADTLSQSLNIPRVSTGGMLRAIDRDTSHPLYTVVHDMFEKHVYLDATTLLEVVADRFKQPDIEEGCVLDGGFRTVDEIHGFSRMLLEADRVMSVTIIELMVPREICIARIIAGNRGRTDDSPEAIELRLGEFYRTYEKRIALIKASDYSHLEIDAAGDIQSVFDAVVSELHSRGKIVIE